jgi:hypothetical protein
MNEDGRGQTPDDNSSNAQNFYIGDEQRQQTGEKQQTGEQEDSFT